MDSDPPHSRWLIPTTGLVLISAASFAAVTNASREASTFPGGLFAFALLALFLNAFFTTAQMAVASIGPSSINELESRKTFLARQMRRFVCTMPRLERQFQMAALFAMLMMALLLMRLGFLLMPGYAPFAAVLAVIAAFLLQLLVVEVFARNLALRNPARAFAIVVPPAYLISLPALIFVVPSMVFRIFPKQRPNLASLTDMHLRLLPSLRGIERVLDEDAFEMIDSVRDFAETTAEEVMTPRTEVEAIPDSIPSSELYERLRRAEYSRLVVYHNTIDNVVGTLLVKEVLLQKPIDPWSLLRKPLVVSETTRLPELLKLIRANRTHLVVVLDEYGGMGGVVTLHDLFETIVGHIDDVEDKDELWIEKLDETRYRLNGRVELWELNEELNTKFDEERARTIGGLVFSLLGRVAQGGDRVEVNGAVVEVEQTKDNRVESVILQVAPEDYLAESEAN